MLDDLVPDSPAFAPAALAACGFVRVNRGGPKYWFVLRDLRIVASCASSEAADAAVRLLGGSVQRARWTSWHGWPRIR